MKLNAFKEKSAVFGIVGYTLPLLNILISCFGNIETAFETISSHLLQIIMSVTIVVFVVANKDKQAQRLSAAHWCVESLIFAFHIVTSVIKVEYDGFFTVLATFFLVTSFAIGELTEEKVNFNIFAIPITLSVICFGIEVYHNATTNGGALGYITIFIGFVSNVLIALWLSEHYRAIHKIISNNSKKSR